MSKKLYWVYMLHCDNDSYYTGYTTNVSNRYQAHLHGTGKCKYTRSFKPLGIAQCWQIDTDKTLALKIEHFIKKLSRAEKEQLISRPNLLTKIFPAKTVSKRDIRRFTKFD